MNGVATHDAATTTALLDPERLVAAIERAALEREAGSIACPERLVVPLAGDATMLSMPAVAADVAIHKLVTVAPRNAARGLPTIHGTLTAFEPTSGRPLFVLDGPAATAARTAAVSLCAWRRLAGPGATRVLLIGTGVQAAAHLRAIGAFDRALRVRVRGTSRERAAAFCATHRGVVDDLAVDDGQKDHARGFDVVATCTTSASPVWDEPAREGRLVVAVGSFRPTIAEIAAGTVRGSDVWVDDPAAARHEAGDLLAAGVDLATVGSLASLVRGDAPPTGRPTLFKSVGCAAWDLAAARVAMAALR